MEQSEIEALAKESGHDPMEIKKKYDSEKATIQKNHPHISEKLAEDCAKDAVFGMIGRRGQGTKIYHGVLLACDGKVNDWARRSYNKIMAEAQGMSKEDAMAKGLMNVFGRALYPANAKFGAGKPINPDDNYFAVHGYIIEAGQKVPMTMKVYNMNLLAEVILNKPVSFHASPQHSGKDSKATLLWLKSDPNTFFEYAEVPEKTPDVAMDMASTRFQKLPVKDLLGLVKKEKDSNGNEYFVRDKRMWLLENAIVSFVSKTGTGKTTYEFIHPDLVNWSIVCFFEPIGSEYELVRDHKANILARMITVEEETKRIVLEGVGAWQSSQYRQLHAQKEIDPSRVHMVFKP